MYLDLRRRVRAAWRRPDHPHREVGPAGPACSARTSPDESGYPKSTPAGAGHQGHRTQMNERDGLLRQFAMAFDGGAEKDKHLARETIASFNVRNSDNRILPTHLAQSISTWKARQIGAQAHPDADVTH